VKKFILCLLVVLMTMSSCGTTGTKKAVKWSLLVSGAGLVGGAAALSGGSFAIITGKDPERALALSGFSLLILSAVAFLLDYDYDS
jgi:hypothetical protein